MHIALPVGKNGCLTANDVPASLGVVSEREHRSKILVRGHDTEEAKGFFLGLSEGGEIEIPFEESPDGSCFAMFRDRYGIEWMVEFDPNNPG